jgi:proteic killer suppression protein
VYIDFSSNQLSAAAVSFSVASRLLGIPIGRKFIQRLAIIRSADSFTELFGFQSLRLHPLKGNRAGQFSITLTANYRLIVEKLKEDHILIVEVEDYHGN